VSTGAIGPRARSLPLGHHSALRGGTRQPRDSVAQGQASRSRLCPTEMPCVRRNPTAGFQLQGARVLPLMPWGTVNCSVGLHRSSWIARSLALGHGTCVLCTSSGAGGRPGCEDRRGHRGTEDILRSALKPNAVKLRPPASEEPPGWFMVQRCFRARFRSARLVASSTHRSTSRLIRA